VKNIAADREDEKVQQRLYDEFKTLDINGDGMITIDEIKEFLIDKVQVRIEKYFHTRRCE